MAAWGAAPPSKAWATQVDEEEQENGPIVPPTAAPAAPAKFRPSAAEPLGGINNEKAFPSLGEAVKKKESKKDKKQKVSLKDFLEGPLKPSRPSDSEILKSLPTAPRVRSDSDDRGGGLGGAFQDYGGDRGFRRGFGTDQDDRSQDGSFDDGPSRADTSASWGADRKFVPSDRSAGRGFGGGGFGSHREGSDDGRSDAGGPSRADTTDNWGKDRAFVPSSDRPLRRAGDDYEGPSKADSEDRWAKKFVPTEAPPARSGGYSDSGDRWSRRGPGDSFSSMPRDRDGLLDRDPSPGDSGIARPRLNLKPRTLPPPELPIVQPSADQQPQAPVPEDLPRPPPKPRSNPFGAARPREEVLKEQGRDWKKDEERVTRDAASPAAEEELKARIAALRAELAGSSAPTRPGDEAPAAANAGKLGGAALAPTNSEEAEVEAKPEGASELEAAKEEQEALEEQPTGEGVMANGKVALAEVEASGPGSGEGEADNEPARAALGPQQAAAEELAQLEARLAELTAGGEGRALPTRQPW